jgi:cytochrome P450 PksS
MKASLRKLAAPGKPPRQEAELSLILNKADPYPFYARLRAEASAHYAKLPDIGSTWLVARYNDALTVFKDPRFVRNYSNTAPSKKAARLRIQSVRDPGAMMWLDPPNYTRLRSLVSRSFTSRRIEHLEGRVQQLADQLLDRVWSQGRMELIGDFAAVIPITIISEMLGVPVENLAALRDITRADRFRLTAELTAIIAARRSEPRDDLISALVKAEHDGDRLSAEEVHGMTCLLFIAGYVTSVNLIGNGALALLSHPDQLDMLRRNPALIESAVEELLRFDGPAKLSSGSFASTDIELSGTRIPRGAQVHVMIASANRDENEFADPDALDITRDARGHLAFGQGIHYCLGAPLARMEGRIALLTLLQRMPRLELAVPSEKLVWQRDWFMRGMKELPVRF